MKKLFFVLALVILIAGCSTKPQRIVVTETEYVYTPIPASFLKDCDVTKPPSKKEYLDTDDVGREDLLASRMINLYGDLRKCASQVRSIKDFDIEQQKIVNKKNKK